MKLDKHPTIAQLFDDFFDRSFPKATGNQRHMMKTSFYAGAMMITRAMEENFTDDGGPSAAELAYYATLRADVHAFLEKRVQHAFLEMPTSGNA